MIFRGVHVGKKCGDQELCSSCRTQVIEEGAQIRHVIADKDVTIKAHRTLTGHASYPLAIDMGSII